LEVPPLARTLAETTKLTVHKNWLGLFSFIFSSPRFMKQAKDGPTQILVVDFSVRFGLGGKYQFGTAKKKAAQWQIDARKK
jgi:hypothetical protein